MLPSSHVWTRALFVLAGLILGFGSSFSYGQALCEGCSQSDGPLNIWPPQVTPPPGCDPTRPSTIGKCSMTPDICTNLPGFHLVGSSGNQFCVPDRQPPGCPHGFQINPVLNDPHCKSFPIHPAGSYDPNDKTGMLGVGTAQYVASGTLLNYVLHFENLATATAPAQTVVVTDQLDPSKVRLDTFAFGPMTFGSTVIVPSPGLQTFSGGADLRPDFNLIVTINAKLDRITGMATWTFLSIDPSTGEVTVDPQAGFLPPNATPPAGEGSVTFMVLPQAALATGTVIANQAQVVFDANAPILTPIWTNTIDTSAPATHVLALGATQSSTSFPVQWTGTDAGSGIQTFSVYVSDNGGAFAKWFDSTAMSSAVYTGQIGHTYGFFSVGKDLVGNTEALKTAADTTTRVGSQPTCATNVNSALQITRSGFTYNLATQRFVQTVTLKNTSAATISSPISLVLDSLSSDATLYNTTGTTVCSIPAGSPFMNWSSNLAPGASASIVLQFIDPTRAGITYATRVLAGSATR